MLPFRSEPGIGAVMMGLSALVGREIEFEPSGLTLAALIEKGGRLVVYLIEHGMYSKTATRLEAMCGNGPFTTRIPNSSMACLSFSALTAGRSRTQPAVIAQYDRA